jgi:drug/metabolite transporter (DMT)-like permease
MKKYLPELALVFTAFMYACLSVATKYMDVGMTANIAFATRSFLAFLIGYFVYSFIFKQIDYSKYKKINLKFWLIYLFLGFFGYGASIILLSYGVLKTNIFTVASIYATIPIFVMLLEYLFFKSKLTLLKVCLIALSILGAILCSVTFDQNLDFSFGAVLVLVGTILSAMYMIGISRYPGDLNSRELGLILMLFASVFGFASSFILGYNIIYENILSFYFILGLLIGASFNLVASTLEPWAFQNLRSPVLGSQILLLEVVFALILGYLLFSELPSMYGVFGSIIITVSVFINNYLE